MKDVDDMDLNGCVSAKCLKLNGLDDVCFIQGSMKVSKFVLDSLGVDDSAWLSVCDCKC